MRFAEPNVLFLLILIPIFSIIIVLGTLQLRKKFTKFASPRFHEYLLQRFSLFYWNVKNALLLLVLFFLIIALARPQWGKEVQIVKKEGIDIVICLDVSKSMKARDIEPNRLKRAKDQIKLFLDQLQGDRISLIAFAGESFVQCPPTDDYSAVKMFLDLLDTESVGTYGTDIGGAINKAMELFSEKDKHKVIILVSDGEDLAQNSIKIAKEAVQNGAQIYSLGIGSPEGTTIPMEDSDGNITYAKDEEGNIVFTKLDISTLSQLAKIGNGKFYPITPQQSEIFAILQEINQMETQKFDSREYVRYKERYSYFVIIAFIFLFLEAFILYKKRTNYKRVI
ncbi:MAG: VWA domain-containing protein [Candidatus Cloacimonadota bacterium]|nr:VWA domain-containing protein [Candidatus Cloacimonadota bacterium]